MRKSSQSAFVIGFDKEDIVMMLSDANAGKLFKEIFKYNRGDETAGDSFKGALKIAFMSIKQQNDWFNEKYEKRCELNRANGAKGGKAKKQNVANANSGKQNVPKEKAKAKAKEKENANANAVAAVKADSALAAELFDGSGDDAEEIEENSLGAWNDFVMLSNNQVGALIEKMSLEEFNYYVDKLSSFIKLNDAKIKSHYKTILKWYDEDRRVD